MFKVISHLVLLFISISNLYAVGVENDLDLNGQGKIKIQLPFKYYPREKGEELEYIYQGGYRVYDVKEDKNKVAIIGPLNPCIGIAVTDGKKAIVFHKHASNSLMSLENILRINIDFSEQSELYARAYSARDDEFWEKII